MEKRWKIIILFTVLLQLSIVFGLTLLPPVAQTLPGELRVRIGSVPLGAALLDIGTTPMPTALPVPVNAVVQAQISIPAIEIATTEPAATATTTTLSEPAVATNLTRPTTTPLPTNTPTAVPLPRQVRIEGVTIMPQGFNNCGPANLAINLNFYGDPTTQAEAAAYLKPTREDRNVSPWQMVDYVNDFTNLRAFFGSGGDLQLLKQLIAAGYPVVIEKGYELPREGWLGHYLTVFGYDDETGEMVSMDTNLGPWDGSGRYDSYEEIETYWSQFNHNFFVVYPPEKEQDLYAILGSDMLDYTTMWQRAAQKAQAAIEENPENAFAWFNLGTSLTRLGEQSGEAAFYENGAAAFDQAFILGLPPRILWYEYRPYVAYMRTGRYQEMLDLADEILSTQGGQHVEETYIYKGHALTYLKDHAGAVEAFQQAVTLNENSYMARWALDSVTGE